MQFDSIRRLDRIAMDGRREHSNLYQYSTTKSILMLINHQIVLLTLTQGHPIITLYALGSKVANLVPEVTITSNRPRGSGR